MESGCEDATAFKNDQEQSNVNLELRVGFQTKHESDKEIFMENGRGSTDNCVTYKADEMMQSNMPHVHVSETLPSDHYHLSDRHRHHANFPDIPLKDMAARCNEEQIPMPQSISNVESHEGLGSSNQSIGDDLELQDTENMWTEGFGCLTMDQAQTDPKFTNPEHWASHSGMSSQQNVQEELQEHGKQPSSVPDEQDTLSSSQAIRNDVPSCGPNNHATGCISVQSADADVDGKLSQIIQVTDHSTTENESTVRQHERVNSREEMERRQTAGIGPRTETEKEENCNTSDDNICENSLYNW